jgi:hypothetical protein
MRAWHRRASPEEDGTHRHRTCPGAYSRVYEALSLALDRLPEELQSLMDVLIGEWKRQTAEVMRRFGYEVP